MNARTASSRLLFATLLLLAAPVALARVVLYVDGRHGSDNNDCRSRQTACKTIGHAISLASPGYVISVAPAVYQENLAINFDLGLIGSGAATTIIDGQAFDTVININSGHVVIAGFTIRNGYTDENDAGGVENSGVATIADSIITANVGSNVSGDCVSGGIFNPGVLNLRRTIVSQNKTVFNYYSCGSGILSYGTMTINDCTISGNTTTTASPTGGGIYNGGTMVINRSTISANVISGVVSDAGGIYNGFSATLELNNSTIYGNGAEVGGGIEDDGASTISSTTISGNSATYKGGGIAAGGKTVIQNSIVSGSTGGNCSGTVTSNGYNLSDDSSCNLTGPGDLNNTKPLLGPLQNNGGPTQTQAEFLGSPTVDAGNPNGCTDGQGNLLTTDQRGAPRPGKNKQDKRCDMGAFERQND